MKKCWIFRKIVSFRIKIVSCSKICCSYDIYATFLFIKTLSLESEENAGDEFVNLELLAAQRNLGY